MAIVAGFDVHRRQITFDALDTETGEVVCGRIDATPAAVAVWVKRFAGQEVHVAVEACTGWLFVANALTAMGAVAHLAEPVETSALRGRKRRAKTDRQDARWLRELPMEGRLPEAWIPPEHVRQWRARARMRHTLIDERTQWLQRIQATAPRWLRPRARHPHHTARWPRTPTRSVGSCEGSSRSTAPRSTRTQPRSSRRSSSAGPRWPTPHRRPHRPASSERKSSSATRPAQTP
jgi:transposase